MIIEEALRATEAALMGAGIAPYKFEAKELLALALGCLPQALRLRLGEDITEDALCRLEEYINRRVGGEPLQYIVGQWEFYSLPFMVGPGVLIPRADTELLVDKALDFLKGKGCPKVADLCSGSGCIAVATAVNRPDCKVDAYELSTDAIKYLKQNIALNNTNVNIINTDILAADCTEKYDIILSNPPYIESDIIKELETEVQKEPHMALDGGSDGLTFYRAIAKKWVSNLKPGGALMVEIGINQHTAVEQLFIEAGLIDVHSAKDINGIERVIIGTMPL
ncbi:MAG: peptide chain release factor N(5)-glutamine methyltransferase [Clostridia bacterium]|nr:peptide chain release factor N(5)-glutamine methyltransferase [Clostridia bacterium]